jgi:pimeloyl-ACP methyl ester carboxylesterase
MTDSPCHSLSSLELGARRGDCRRIAAAVCFGQRRTGISNAFIGIARRNCRGGGRRRDRGGTDQKCKRNSYRAAHFNLREVSQQTIDRAAGSIRRSLDVTRRRLARHAPFDHVTRMTLTQQSIALPTGVKLDVTISGDKGNPPVFFLHGFPESARTWRHQMKDLSRDYFVVAPDQRGFARSSKPDGVENYTHDKPIADLFALADALEIGTFTLVGHDWGGAIAWAAALGNPARVIRLAIVNAPHPFVFQKAMFDDMGQRAASQYIRRFREPGMETYIAGDLDNFFEKTFKGHFDLAFSDEEKAAYIDEWSQPGTVLAMMNWYRAAGVIVPAMDEHPPRPAYLDSPFPVLKMPVLVVWGMQDKALTPSQLVGLEDLCADLTLVKVEDAGHFVTWEKPEAVTGALRRFLR